MTRRLALVLALLGASSPARAQPRRPAPRAPARPALVDYRVLPGDTCAAIAQRLYRDVRRTNLIHENNPALGRPPHRLRPGQVLRLPRAAPTRAEPDAILTQTLNTVEIGAPTGRRARGLDPLFRGTTVSTGSASTAEVTFADETQL
ncbi:MAG: LysM peptidoglycan-binding domain-containing protein, partial [Polyangiales bacterium]